jgi:hypothetical protein
MTYNREVDGSRTCDIRGAVVSHLAELVRGNFQVRECRPPHPPLRGTFSPRGEGFSRCQIHPTTSFSALA